MGRNYRNLLIAYHALGIHFLNLAPVNFEAFLISKKIDPAAFQKAEANLWNAWQTEFEQLHPASFTAQKLYLINPIRRKYPLQQAAAQAVHHEPSPAEALSVSRLVEAKPKPVMRPKPKIS